jgi:hypothetical protein
MTGLSESTLKRFRLFGADQILSTELAAKIIAGAQTRRVRLGRHIQRARVRARVARRQVAEEKTIIRETKAALADLKHWSRATLERRIGTRIHDLSERKRK